MKSALILTTVVSLLASAVRGSPSKAELGLRGTDGYYVQNPSGTASFTYYYGCGNPGKHHYSHSIRTHTLSTVPPQHVARPLTASVPR